jgi:hypothetical protein
VAALVAPQPLDRQIGVSVLERDATGDDFRQADASECAPVE